MPTPDDAYLKVVRMRLGEARRARKMTQEDAADAADLPLRTYQGLESVSSKRPFNPTLRTLRSVASAVGLSVSDLTQDPAPDELKALEHALTSDLAAKVKRTSP